MWSVKRKNVIVGAVFLTVARMRDIISSTRETEMRKMKPLFSQHTSMMMRSAMAVGYGYQVLGIYI